LRRKKIAKKKHFKTKESKKLSKIKNLSNSDFNDLLAKPILIKK